MTTDAKPLRVMIFPDRPDCILFYVPEGTQLIIPPLAAPFYRATTAEAIAKAGVKARLTESVPGRWTTSMTMMRNAERAERGQQQRQREATQAALERSGTPLARTRAEAVAKKLVIDEQIREAKDWIRKASSNARVYGKFETPERFRRKEKELAELKQESQALQTTLGDLRRQESVEHSRSADQRVHLFYRTAQRLLSDEQLEEIFDVMADELDAEDAREEGAAQ